jgi:Uma2 family endonuclease
MSTRAPRFESGPFRVDQLEPGDRYELSAGNASYCAPTGGDGARGTGAGFEVLDTDPAVESAGIDAGFASTPNTLRAPDISVGGVPDEPGWISGTPPLAVEYAGTGQNEDTLQQKIEDLLSAGTRWVWVVRLLGPRRVEVYEPEQAMRTVGPGGELLAPGVLQNPVPVEALYDRKVAHEATLRNLLQRKGYESLDAVKEHARAEGLTEGATHERARAILAVLDARGIVLRDAGRARVLATTDLEQLDAWLRRAAVTSSEADLFD